MGAVALDGDERRQQRRRPAQASDDQGAPPALRVAADEAEDQQEEGKREGDDAGEVDRLRVLGEDVDDLALGQDHRPDPDRDVEEEDPLPAEALGDDAADQRPDRDRAADHGSPDAERGRPVFAVELLADQGQRGGEHPGAADALQPAREVEQGRVLGDAAEERGEGEDPEPDREHAPAPEPVAERAGGEQEGGEGQRVGIDDPLQAGEAGVQFTLDVRQGDVDDGDVEQQHERRDRDQDQGPPFPLHGGGP